VAVTAHPATDRPTEDAPVFTKLTDDETALASVTLGQLPAGVISAAITSKKIVIATCTPCTVVSRSVLISVIMTFMLEPAKLQMNCANASGANIPRTIRPLPCMTGLLQSAPSSDPVRAFA
jgi:hypothetical protein